MWSNERLIGYLRRRLDKRRPIVVANREPYVHEWTPEGIRCTGPDSGLVSALDPVLRATGGVWIAHGSGAGDRQTSDARGRLPVPPGSGTYTLRRVWLGREEEEGFYYRNCHQGLWPLCHAAQHRPEFHPDDWDQYVRVNERFAAAVVEEAGDDHCLVFVQNYHFALLPGLLRGRLPKATLCAFWHLPWPGRDALGQFPWRKQLIGGLLGGDLVFFHLREHCDGFLDAAERELCGTVDRGAGAVTTGGRVVRIRPDPIGVDAEEISRESSSAETVRRSEEWRTRLSLGSRRVLLSVGRFDYTEGVPQRVRAFGRLLELHHEYRRKVVLLEVAIPARGSLPSYSRFRSQAVSLIEEVNRTYGTEDWQPIVVVSEHQSRADLSALYRLADVFLVTSLHDGMSLAAKEYVAARAEAGALVLSTRSGAASELRRAILVDPSDLGETAGALRHALELPVDERDRVWEALRLTVRSRNVFRWAGKLFKEALSPGGWAPAPRSPERSYGKAAGSV